MNDSAPETTMPAAELLRDLAEEIEEGKKRGYVLIMLNHEDGSVTTPIYNPGNTHVIYSLLHDVADKIKTRAANEVAAQGSH